MVPDTLNIRLAGRTGRESGSEAGLRRRRAGSRDDRHRGPAGGAGPQRRDARRRRRRRRPAAGQLHPAADDHRQGRRHHAVGRSARRAGRPVEDGLSGPAEPHDPRQGGAQRAASTAASRSIPSSCRSTTSKTFELLQRGETKGIFQLESGGMRDLLTKMKPDSFNDIIATSALYRPGPLEGGMVMTYVNVKHGIQPIPKVHPDRRRDPGRDLRRDGLPGTGDADSEPRRAASSFPPPTAASRRSARKSWPPSPSTARNFWRDRNGQGCRRRRPPNCSA